MNRSVYGQSDEEGAAAPGISKLGLRLALSEAQPAAARISSRVWLLTADAPRICSVEGRTPISLPARHRRDRQSEFLQLIWQVVGLAYFLHVGSQASKENAKRQARPD